MAHQTSSHQRNPVSECGRGGIGRHTILRGWRPKGHASSNLADRTIHKNPRSLELQGFSFLCFHNVANVKSGVLLFANRFANISFLSTGY